MEKQVGLQEYLENFIQPEEHFIIDNDEKANWALRKIKAKQEQQTANAELAAREILKIQDWLNGQNKELDGGIFFLQNLLHQYADSKKKVNPKFKSYKLPEGSIRFKKQNPDFNRDDISLLNFFETNGMEQFIKVAETKTPRWAEFKEECEVKDGKLIHKETGLIVDVVGVVERPEKFEVVI